MKVYHKLSYSTPLLIGLFSLLMGVGLFTVIWAIKQAITQAIFYPVSESSTILEIQPAKFNPQIYWLEIVDNRIRLTPTTAYTTATTSQAALIQAFAELLHDNSNLALNTTIPKQTRLLNLHTNQDDIYVDLSQEFSYNGRNSSMIYRLAQVLYTATSLEPQGQVFLSIEGQPLNQDYLLGREKLSLEYPLTRQKFTRDFLIE
jgi:spore germination protein GerM